MNPTLAPLGETKVLDRIRDVDVARRYLSFPQCILQQPSGRTNKGNALTIFDVAGLLSDESQRCLSGSRPKRPLGLRASTAHSPCSPPPRA